MSRPSRHLLVHIVFALYVVCACAAQPGWDLTASFVAGRLIAIGRAEDIYGLANQDGAGFVDPLWAGMARQGGIADGVVTPYVQTPLWAWATAPLAAGTDFATFKLVFAAALAGSMIGLVRLGTRLWAPSLSGAAWRAVLFAALALSVPCMQVLVFTQTHLLFLLLSVAAAASCLAGAPLAAGALLAVAACVKITPGCLALAWLAAGRWRACLSFAVCSVLLAVATVLVAGPALTGQYVHVLQHYGHTVYLGFNNDSLATVLLSARLTATTAFRPDVLPMPPWVGLVSVGLTVAAALAGGLLDRRHPGQPNRQLGSLIALTAATAFAPLAWNHYFVILILPAMVFLQRWRTGGGRRWAALAVLIAALDMWPIAYTVGAPLSAVARRSEFWAALLCLAGLAVIAYGRREGGGTRSSFAAAPPLPCPP